MAEKEAPTHDFFSADLSSKGWLPGISWAIQSAGGNRATNETQFTGAPSSWSNIKESRTILDSPTHYGPLMPGASGVRGAIRTPTAGSRYGSGGSETHEEATLRNFIGKVGQMRRGKNIAGNATGGRGRASGAGGMASGSIASNVGNQYEAGRDNVVGSNYIGGNVGDSASVNQGTNYGVIGGQNNRVNQLYFRGGQPQSSGARTAGGQPRAQAAGPAAAPAAGARPRISPQARMNGQTPAQAPAATNAGAPKAAAPTVKPVGPSATKPTERPTIATTTDATPTAPSAVPAAPAASTGATGGTKATKAAKSPTAKTPKAPKAGAATGGSKQPKAGKTTNVNVDVKAKAKGKADATGEVTSATTTGASVEVAAATGAPTTTDSTTTTSKKARPKVSTSDKAKSGGTPKGRMIDEEVGGDEYHGMMQEGQPGLERAMASRFPGYKPPTSTSQDTGLDLDNIKFNDDYEDFEPNPELAAEVSDAMAAISSRRKSGAGDNTSTTSEAPAMGIQRPPSVQKSPAIDPLIKAQQDRIASGAPEPQGPYTDQIPVGDTFKKIRAMASRALRRGGR